MIGKKAKAPAKAPAPAEKPVDQRGKEWQAERLTGVRAQRLLHLPPFTLQALFPNLARMARRYLGCPASSATVERLFSVVGIAFSDKRKTAKASTLEAIAFTKLNLP